MNLAFSCTLRMGELLGLTWDCVDISQTSIDTGQAYIFVNKELQRVRRDALEAMSEKGVILKFSMAIRGMNTLLVLKEPKTKTSVRKIFLPRSVAEMLAKHKREQDEIRELFGEEYIDYNLVFASTNGRPMEASNITRMFNDLIRKNNLPKVVFHSLRHTSITYKLKLNGGDMKSVQGDSGDSADCRQRSEWRHHQCIWRRYLRCRAADALAAEAGNGTAFEDAGAEFMRHIYICRIIRMELQGSHPRGQMLAGIPVGVCPLFSFTLNGVYQKRHFYRHKS